MIAQASCPTSLSFMFGVIKNKSLLKTGSIGVGCTLDKKVMVEVSLNTETKILFNGKKISLPTVSQVISSLTDKNIAVKISSGLPLGCGFGVSAASALACGSAINKLLNLHKKASQLIEIAHIAEINNKTGLGTVGTETTGGFLVKISAGIPVTDYYRLPLVGKKIYVLIIGKIETPSVLKNNKLIKKITFVAKSKLKLIRKDMSLEDLLDLSLEFDNESGLFADKGLKKIISGIRERGGSACMASVGKVIISSIKPPKSPVFKMERLTITNSNIS